MNIPGQLAGSVKRWTLSLLLLAALLVSGWGVLEGSFWARVHSTPILEQVDLWRERIKRVGAGAAYHDFVMAEDNVDKGMRHRYAHVFGNALYTEKGVAGIGVCDTQFQFGCLHEFFGHLIAEHGLGVLSSVVESCSAQTGRSHPCQHALGHGILSYLGYNLDALREAHDRCDALYRDDPINGCMGGVFMEFNLYESLSLEVKPRDAEQEGWYSPCTALPDAYQRSCSWWLPQWWHEYMFRTVDPPVPPEARFKKMGEMCRNLPNARFVRECFQQVGQLTIWGAAFDPDAAVRLCHAASVSKTERLLCLSYAAYIFKYYNDDLAEALLVCDGLDPGDAEFCRTYARREAYVSRDIPLPPEQ